MTSLMKLCSCLVNRSRPAISAQVYMQSRGAGHAKWQNVKHTKQANDLAKGKLISSYVMSVRRAVISGGMQTDPKLNRKLGEILAEAGKFNVPKATLERAITRATNLRIISLTLELQGSEGYTIIAKCETDNVAFLRRDVKKLLRKHDINLAPDGTLINMFRSQGFIRADTKTKDGREIDENFAEDAAILSNAQELTKEPYGDSAESWVFSTDAETLNQCKSELEKQGFNILSSDLELVPYREVDFGPIIYEKVMEIMKVLREHEQVLDVYHNVAEPKE